MTRIDKIKAQIIARMEEGWSVHMAVKMAGLTYVQFLDLRRRDKLFDERVTELFGDRNRRNRSFMSTSAERE